MEASEDLIAGILLIRPLISFIRRPEPAGGVAPETFPSAPSAGHPILGAASLSSTSHESPATLPEWQAQSRRASCNCPALGIFNKHVQNGTDFPQFLEYSSEVRLKDLTPRQVSSIPCPTCGVPAGKRCLLHSGSPRTEPHIERKLSAAEALEAKKD